jgi:hypothetical protein
MEKRKLEQCYAIKFCVKLNENTTETYEKLKKAYGEHALSRTQVFRWHKKFWIAVSVWKTNLVLEDLARQKRTKIWPMWRISWGLIDVWQSEWSVLCWIWIAKQSTKFWPSNWACGKFADTWMLHHDNAPCHTALSVNDVLPKNCILVVPQPPQSSDLRPCDFFFFPKLKFHLKGHLGTVDNIQKIVTYQLRALTHGDFQHCYQEWKQCLRRVWLPKRTTLKEISLIYR